MLNYLMNKDEYPGIYKCQRVRHQLYERMAKAYFALSNFDQMSYVKSRNGTNIDLCFILYSQFVY